MAIPRVFVSSTCYDLKYIRENLRYFIKTLGYEPILSEDGSVFFNPLQHTHDACLTEIPNTQIFVLIIGGRFGGKYHSDEASITNVEYREALRLKIPVFALVENAVYNEHHLYTKNLKNNDVDLAKLVFPAVDSTKIFEFINEVRGSAINNAIVPFRDFADIENYLRQQWAGMMHDFLSQQNEQERVGDTLKALGEMNERIEMLSKQILKSVGTEEAKIDAKLYEEMLASEAIRDLAYWKVRPTPVHVLLHSTFRACAKSIIGRFNIDESDDGLSIGSDHSISRGRFSHDSHEYKALRARLIQILKDAGMTPESYVTSRPALPPPVTIDDHEDDVVGADTDGSEGQIGS